MVQTALATSEENQSMLLSQAGIVSVLRMLAHLASAPEQLSAEGKNLGLLIKEQLLAFVLSQGKVVTKITGEQPGRFIYREDGITGTPLCLIALYRYWELTQDAPFLLQILPAIEQGLNWIITYGDQDKDFLLEYSPRGITSATTNLLYPLAPIVVQTYAWLALRLWADFYITTSAHYARTAGFGKKIGKHAEKQKEQVNRLFVRKKAGKYILVTALNGIKQPIFSMSNLSSEAAIVWATYRTQTKQEMIIENSKLTYCFRQRRFV